MLFMKEIISLMLNRIEEVNLSQKREKKIVSLIVDF